MLILFALLPIAGTAQADVIHAFGPTILVDAPDPMDGVVDRPQAFSELSADPGASILVNETESRRIAEETLPPTCDTAVTGNPTSDFVFQNPGGVRQNGDVLVFPGPILGVIYERDCMISSDIWGRAGVTYPETGGLELVDPMDDALEILPSHRSLFFRMSASAPGDWDGFRVITERPPVEETDVRLSCTASFEEATVNEGDEHEVTLTLHDDGPVDAADPQIAFRPHVIMTVTTIEGPFDCQLTEGSRVNVCTYTGGSYLPVGATPELRVSLVFDRAPSLSARLLAFGSGFVTDSNLDNNDCNLLAVGSEPLDGGTDAAPDSGSGSDASAPTDPTTTFRGVGGCTCDTAPSPTDGSLAILLATLLALARRR